MLYAPFSPSDAISRNKTWYDASGACTGGGTVLFPLSGYRGGSYNSKGALRAVGRESFFHSAFSSKTATGANHTLYIDMREEVVVKPDNDSDRALGGSVRPVRE